MWDYIEDSGLQPLKQGSAWDEQYMNGVKRVLGDRGCLPAWVHSYLLVESVPQTLRRILSIVPSYRFTEIEDFAKGQ